MSPTPGPAALSPGTSSSSRRAYPRSGASPSRIRRRRHRPPTVAHGRDLATAGWRPSSSAARRAPGPAGGRTPGSCRTAALPPGRCRRGRPTGCAGRAHKSTPARARRRRRQQRRSVPGSRRYKPPGRAEHWSRHSRQDGREFGRYLMRAGDCSALASCGMPERDVTSPSPCWMIFGSARAEPVITEPGLLAGGRSR